MDWEVIKQSAIFRDLEEDELEQVAEICEVQELKFDEYIFREGDEGDRLYIISKGEVRISRDVPGTGEEAIAILKQGACFGEMAVLDPSERSTDAISNSRCTLLSISRSDFELLLDSDRDLAHKLLWSVVRLLCQRLRVTNDNLQSILVMAMF
ncbi:MAG: cyclic nucleotide-binding domain-containing protein [Gemmatimonadetes bacterium]|nr:cyclic nucleotide-binding domain-containing protein [Gemmatimonadota bacterium]